MAGIKSLATPSQLLVTDHCFPTNLRLRAALVQGLEQSGDTAVPRVKVCRNLPKVLRDVVTSVNNENDGPALRLACHPERIHEQPLSREFAVRRMREVIDSRARGKRLVLAVGPERGWEEPEELETLAAHGFELVTLGQRTLRTDVACIALLAVAHECLDALGSDESLLE